MIMLAKAVSYGGNSVRYALEKEKARTVKVNNLPDGLDPTSIWYMMKHHCQLHQADRTVGRKLERFMVTFVLSPSKEESANFTMQDWANLQDEALEVLDSVGLTPKRMKKEVKTNFRNSMNVGGLHSDSKSGTLHLHIDCCRVDGDGKTNDVHDIHLRAMKAAEIINMRHGWKQPQEIRNMRCQELAECCEDTLRNMQEFSFDRYFGLLRTKGYEVKPRYDKKGKLVGYTVGKNASVFKASEIGRKFMVSKLEATWQKLHPKPAQVKMNSSSPSVAHSVRSARPALQTSPSIQPRVVVGHHPQVELSKPQKPTYSDFAIRIGNETKWVSIPDEVKNIFTDGIQIPEGNEEATVQDITHVAMLLFAGYLDAATSMSESCGGGGDSPKSGWGRKEDEDDWKFAHRCVQMAHSMCKPKPRTRSFHR